MDRNNDKLKLLYKSIKANTSAVQNHAAHPTHQLSSPSPKQDSYQKACVLMNNTEEFLEKSQENGPVGGKKDKTEKAIEQVEEPERRQ